MPRELLLDRLPLPDAARPHVRWSQLHGSGLSLAAAEAAARHGGTVCVIAPSAAAADRIEREIEFFGGAPVRRFPSYETLPYEPISPPQDLLADRLLCLYQLARGERLTLVVEAGALLDRLPPREFVVSRSLQLKVGDNARARRDDPHADRARLLARRASRRAGRVRGPRRGARRVSDRRSAARPDRSLRRRDREPADVRSRRRSCRPARPTRCGSCPRASSRSTMPRSRCFRERFRERFPVDPTRCPVYRMISEAQLPAGIEYYLPLFFASTVTLLEYLGAGALLVAAEDALAGLDDSWRLVEERYEQLRGDIERPILAPRDGFVAPDEIRARLDVLRTLTLVAHASEDDGGADAAPALNAGITHPLSAGVAASDDRITRWTENEADERTLLATSSPGHREMMLELLRQRGREPVTFASWQDFLASDAALGVGVAELGEGLRFAARKIRLVTSTELGMERPKQRQRRRRARDPETVIRELTDLLIGAPVVHEDHGVGRYRGLTTLEVDGVLSGVPAARIRGRRQAVRAGAEPAPRHALQRRGARGRAAAQARLATSGRRRSAKRREAARDVGRRAAEPLRTARRARRHANGFRRTTATSASRSSFRSRRPRTSSPRSSECSRTSRAQSRWIASSAATSASARPRSRCAPRSSPRRPASRSRCSCRRRCSPSSTIGRSATASPTGRCASSSCRASGARTGSAAALEGLADGTVDIVIGTHKLLQPDVKFKDLGLVIVDEEHRFGVKHKERLKRLRAEVDVLTLTATPIPRTLNMALGGLRDLSIIATPPADRLAMKTFVGEWNDRADPRGRAARAPPRRADLLRAQRRREHRDDRRASSRKLLPEARRARRPRPDARARARAADARLLPSRVQRAGLHDDHRERHRRADRQHDHHRPRRSTRSRAAAPAARPRRPLASPSVRVSRRAADRAR